MTSQYSLIAIIYVCTFVFFQVSEERHSLQLLNTVISCDTWLFQSCTSVTPEVASHDNRNNVVFFANLRCLCFLFCRDDGFHVSSIYIYLSMHCVIILCPCGTKNCSCVMAVITWICRLYSFDTIWIKCPIWRWLLLIWRWRLLINLQTNERSWLRFATVFCLEKHFRCLCYNC